MNKNKQSLKSKKLFRSYKIFFLLFFALASNLITSIQVSAVEVPTDQSQGTLAAILNSERINPEPTEPLTEPLLEIVTELPNSELMVPFLELIYAVTPSEGQTLEEVYVNVNGEYDRHLYQKKAGEPEVTERTFGEARLFLSTDEQESRFELVAVDSSNRRTYYPIEQSFWLSENPEPPLPTIADVTTEDYYGEEVTFINNRLHLQLYNEKFVQENEVNAKKFLDDLLDELAYYDMVLIAGPDKNARVTILLKQTPYRELNRFIRDLKTFTEDIVTDGEIEEMTLAAADRLQKKEEPVNRSVEFKPEMLKIGWVPGLFFRRYQDNVILFKFHEESAFLNPESFPETYLSKALIKEKIDEAVAAIGGVRLEENRLSYPYVQIAVGGNTPRNLVKKGQQLLTNYPEVFSKGYVIIRGKQNNYGYTTTAEYKRRWRVMSTFEERNYPIWATINRNGTVSSIYKMGLRGLPTIVKLLGGAGLFCGILSFAIFIYRKRPPRKKHEFWG
ncbi:Uncharacterised protein [Enterococcus casseliflavus]|uniref:hypothetical protein n=1 Tax=Enterococcus casseliflavus TaxID=37734 RepID=UPI000DFE65EC|nr:hypothetical protein [Enterococcus casseliflavus]GEB27340.1 hypothetical protein ECA02_04350 [Enterococcus casseliflavus]STP33791.1 Uncharacterised protein [Enterococcus casseliflavus]